ncbi:MAG: precorrin-2 C(20)-methyltransferase [Oscillospiraceae bacterium]|nr:precorrin-2 C(20)-methyltransferase [Oscillospiraceae bacterium]
MQNKGILYSIGVGPGDPELLTLKAVKTIGRCPVVAAPRTGGGDMLALDIARQAADLAGKTIVPLDYSMTRDETARERQHSAAAEAIEAHLAAGRDVALLNLGDVSIYATCGYLREKLKAKGYESVMIPGVPSFCAVAARLDMSLTDRDEPLHIIPGGAGGLDAALAFPGTRVLMKSGKSLPMVLEALRDRGCLEGASMVVNCGLPEELVCRDLRKAPEDARYFATVVVKGKK